ncbi:MAG: hypothetical protein Q4C67_11030, partial [Deinococcus sp.]|nr:hypothetical protein [Deinococcus sp.]
ASRGAAVRLVGNPDFAQGLENWSTQTAGSEKDALALAPSATVQLVQDAAATGGRFLRVSQNWFEVAHRRPLPVNPARTYRLTARARRTAVESDRIWAGVACLGPELQLIAVRYGAYWSSTPWKPPMGEWDIKTGTFSGSGSTETNFPAGTAFIRPFFKFNGDSRGGTSDLDLLLWEDVTSETVAGGYAAASQQSAANAKASSDLAGERAEAARGWSVKAETAQTAANTAAGTAADQAKVAQQQAAAAVNSAAAAKSSSDAAGTQAQAAQASRVAAEAARDNAAGSAGTASERARAAATSAEQAAASSTSAGQSAEAARGWTVKAESAQTAAQQSATNAAGSAATASTQAGAAAESASQAKSSSDAAGSASNASQASRLAAEAARDSAGGSASTADTRAKAAATSAEQAAASSTSAGQSAEAARGWTVKAESAQTAAQQSATNAAGSASAAQTQASAAAGSAAQAKTHSDAAGSASNAAQSSALSAEASWGAAVRLAGNPDFAQGLEGWTHYAAGTEAAVPTLTESAGVQLVALAAARGGRVLRPLSQYMVIGYRRPVPVDPARTYRLTVRARRTVDQGRGAAGVICLDAEGRELARRFGSYFQNWPWTSPVGEWDTKTALYT